MSQYKVTQGPLTLPPGIVVRLTEQQAKLREHALKKRKNGLYEVILPVQFKNGEILSFEEIPNKAILAAFFPIEKIKEIQAELKTQQKDSEKSEAKNGTTKTDLNLPPKFPNQNKDS